MRNVQDSQCSGEITEFVCHSVTHILREIKVCELGVSKFAILTNLEIR